MAKEAKIYSTGSAGRWAYLLGWEKKNTPRKWTGKENQEELCARGNGKHRAGTEGVEVTRNPIQDRRKRQDQKLGAN